MKSMRTIIFTTAGLFGLIALVAMPATADQVFLDDVIVDGSLCVGFDCVNGESFGFDTIRLKENNLRIDFTDTSNSASFPTEDWLIAANDTSNGGRNAFFISDESAEIFTLENDAQSHAIYATGNRIGFGTNNPVVELHIVDGDTPTIRLEQDGSSGFTPQTWDLAGNETNFFIRDVTNGSKLPLRIRPSAPTSAVDIAGNGEVGINTSSPGADLHVLAGGSAFAFNSATVMALQNNAATTDGMIFAMMGGSSGNAQMAFGDSGNFANGRIRFNNSDDSFDFDTAGVTRVTISSAGLVTTTSGGACNPGPCDGTFDPSVYEVESIDEHSQYMWENKHLWGVGPTPEDGPINVTDKLTGVLHELEKAHIYIEQLHKRLEALEAADAD